MVIRKMSMVVVASGLVASSLVMGPVDAHAQGMQDLKTYCTEDIERLCKGIEPGGGRLLACLQANKKGMSVGCAQALQKMKGSKG